MEQGPAARVRAGPTYHRGTIAFLAAGAAVAATEAFVRFVAYRVPPVHGALFAIPLMAAIFAVLYAGPVRSAAAVALVAAYAIPFYDGLDTVFPRRLDRLMLGATVVAVTIGMAAGAGYLKRHADRLAARAVAAEHTLRLNEERRRAAAEETNRLLRDKNEDLEAFAYLISHDIKEPVRAVEAYLSILAEEHQPDLAPEGRDLLVRAREGTERLARIIAGLLEVARAARIDTADSRPVHVASALGSGECVGRFRALAEERSASVEIVEKVAGAAALATVPALGQIVGNLVCNSIQHNPHEAPRIRITIIAVEGSWIEILVEDDGPGMPDDVAARVESGGRPTSYRDGGFGLTIVRRTVHRLRGEVRVGRSPDLGGAAVRVRLPRAAATPLPGAAAP